MLKIVPQSVELCLIVDGNDHGLVRRKSAGQCQETVPRTGAIWLTPIGVEGSELTITAPLPKTMHLYLPSMLFRRLSDDFGLSGEPARSIRYAAGFRDEMINQIGRSILSEMTNETAVSRMYVEAASLSLGARIIQGYSDSGVPKSIEGVSHQLDHARLRRVLDYISTRITDEITLAGLAHRRPQQIPFRADVQTCHRRFASALCQPDAAREGDGGNSRWPVVACADRVERAVFFAGKFYTRIFPRNRSDTGGVSTVSALNDLSVHLSPCPRRRIKSAAASCYLSRGRS
jgi:hypothetical protein